MFYLDIKVYFCALNDVSIIITFNSSYPAVFIPAFTHILKSSLSILIIDIWKWLQRNTVAAFWVLWSGTGSDLVSNLI